MKLPAAHLPAQSLEEVAKQLSAYPDTEIRLVPPRSRKLGTYSRTPDGKHLITLNDNLPPYVMLIVLVHEMAHLENRLQNGRTVSPHGKEWKAIYSRMLKEYIYRNIFPKDLAETLMRHVLKPCATFPKELMHLLEE